MASKMHKSKKTQSLYPTQRTKMERCISRYGHILRKMRTVNRENSSSQTVGHLATCIPTEKNSIMFYTCNKTKKAKWAAIQVTILLEDRRLADIIAYNIGALKLDLLDPDPHPLFLQWFKTFS